MPKHFYRRRYRGSRDKYSVEQSASIVVVPAATGTTPGQNGIVVVPPTTIQGMRKVKHISISLAHPAATAQAAPTSIFWALVYVPQGTGIGTLNINQSGIGPASDFYEPNQYVMNCGVADFEAGPVRISSPLSRNLNSGDQIALILANPATSGPIGIDSVVRYAITLQ